LKPFELADIIEFAALQSACGGEQLYSVTSSQETTYVDEIKIFKD